MGEDEHLRVSDGVWAGMERDVFPRAWDCCSSGLKRKRVHK